MKKLAFWLCIGFLSFGTLNSYAGSCEKIEYAELKDTPKEDLITRLCKYNKFYKISKNESGQLYKIGATKDSSAASADATECLDEIGKINRVLKNTHKTEPPAECLQFND